MKWLLKTVYDTLWFRCHPVWGTQDGRTIYPTLRACWETARILNS